MLVYIWQRRLTAMSLLVGFNKTPWEKDLNNPYATPGSVLSEPVADNVTYKPKLFAIQGRIGRLRYLSYTFATTLILSFVLGILVATLFPLVGMPGSAGGMICMGLIYISLLLIPLIITKRRLNDLDHAGWWALLMVVPFVNLLMGLYLTFGAGTKGSNRYGLPPAKNSTLVVIGAMGLPVVAVIGMLAAIAIPAYQQYQLRAKAAQVLQQQQP